MNTNRYDAKVKVELEAIQASAGAGKTFELTSRYLHWVLQDTPPERILATTFTRKAAGEILERVLLRLARAVLEPDQARALGEATHLPQLQRPEQFFQPLKHFLNQLHRVNISTIDAYFNRLASSFRYELGLPPELNLLDETSPRAVQLRLESVRQVLAGGDAVVTLIERWLQRRPKRAITEALDQELRTGYDWFRSAPESAWRFMGQRMRPGPSEGEVAHALGLLRIQRELVKDKRLLKAVQGLVTLAEQGDQKGILEHGLVKKVLEGETQYYAKPLPSEVLQGCEVLGRAVISTRLTALAGSVEAIGVLLSHFDGFYSEQRRRARAVLFSDLPVALSARVALLEQEAIEHRLDTSTQHLLLDEFQDTSLQQWAVLRPMARHIAQQGGSVFAVGDTKQAIYGWRGGCAEIFEALEHDLEGLLRTTREKSYRSSQVVLEVVNRVFNQLGQNPVLEKYPGVGERWQQRFRPHQAARTLPGHVRYYVAPMTLEDEAEEGLGEPSESTEGEETGTRTPHPLERRLAEEVQRLTEQLPQASVGILVRTNAAVKRLLLALQKRGVEASGEGGNAIDDDPAVEVVLSAMTLADHPGDGVAAFRVLHSPLAEGLGLTHHKRAGVASERLRKRIQLEGLAGVIADWTQQLAPQVTARSVRRLLQLVTLAERYDPQRTLRHADFVAYVRATQVEEPSPARVRVMTVHKSKGLEFDIVYLLELEKQLLTHRPNLLAFRAGPLDPVEGIFPNPPKELRGQLKELAHAHADHERTRLMEDLCGLYVGMTRARYALHMWVPARKALQSGELRKLPLSANALLRAALTDPACVETSAGDVVLFETGAADWHQQVYVSQPMPVKQAELSVTGGAGGQGDEKSTPWRIPLKPPERSLRNLRVIHPSGLEQESVVTLAGLFRAREAQRFERGVLWHAWLAGVEWMPALGKPLLSWEQAQTLAIPVPEKPEPEQWHPMWQDLCAAFEQPSLRAVLTKPEVKPGESVECWRERSFVVQLEKELVRGAFDRVVVWRHAGQATRAHLLDYKSDRVDVLALKGRAEFYRPQLEAYRKALALLLKLPLAHVGASLVWIEAGEVQTLSV